MRFTIKEIDKKKAEEETVCSKNILLATLLPKFKDMKLNEEKKAEIKYSDYNDKYLIKRIA